MRGLLHVVSAAAIAHAGTAQHAPPNVILVMTDDQGWGDAGYQGHPHLRTPHLDAMAKSGVRFDRFYAGAPVCSPTRGSCLTGRHPYRYGIRGANVGHLPQEEHTLAEILKARGYRTGHFGKWHLGTLTKTEPDSNRGGKKPEHYAPPWEHGFDVAFATEAKVPTFDPMLQPTRSKGAARPGQPRKPYGTAYWTGPGKRASDDPTIDLTGDDSRIIMDRALPFIEQSVAGRTPFFAVVWFHAPHLPVVASPEHCAPYADRSEDEQHYYGCIAAADEQVGRLRSKLRQLGVADNTMLWFCSDNGPEGRAGKAPGTAGPLRGRKRALFEGGVRVPGLLEWPSGVESPRVIKAPCSTLDYLPTILDAIGVAPPRGLDGISLLPLIAGTAAERGRPLGFESRNRAAWMEDRYKLVRVAPRGEAVRYHLFDLLADAAESVDLAEDEPEVVARMAADLETWRASCARSARGDDYGTAPGASRGSEPAPFQATGFKVGEVSDRSAIVWTRLTLREARNPATAPMVSVRFEATPGGKGKGRRRKVAGVDYPEGVTVAGIRDAAPGVAGEVRVRYRPEGSRKWVPTPWQPVDPDRDFTRQFALRELQPNTRYRVQVSSRAPGGGAAGATLVGRFRTAPAPDDAQRVAFTVSTGQAYVDRDGPHGFDLYAAMLELDPHFFVHTGDIVYYDKLAKTIELARYHWQRTYGLPSNVAFHRRVPSYFIKDDHDVWINDCWPTMQTSFMFEFTFAQGLGVFREQVPMGERTYRGRRWGRDLEIWMVEGRDFRSANNAPDGPEKTIWGAEQMAWFKESVARSDATFRVLISPTPVVGPDRSGKRDNHSNANFAHEGGELRRFLAAQKNMVVVCGDRHWQYMSVHPTLGLREYSCGPASNAHAGGWNQKNFVEEYHRYLRVKGGFLSVTVERTGGVPAMTMRFHDTNGEVWHTDRITGG